MSIYKPMKCLRCGHEWVARIMKVRLCPKCKSYLWDRPKQSPSPRIDGKSDLEQVRDVFLHVGVPFNSAELNSVELGSQSGKRKSDTQLLKSRHRIKIGVIEFLFDDKGGFLGVDEGAHFSPRE